MEPPPSNSPPLKFHIVTADDSPNFSLLRWAIRRSSVIGLDAEWRPVRNQHGTSPPSFPNVALLQIACRLRRDPAGQAIDGSPVFLLDLLSIPLPDVSELLRDLFVSPHVLKLGFRFKQDLAYLSSTFSNKGCPGFDRVEPFLDVTSIYYRLKDQKDGKKLPKDTKSLASICKEMLDITLSKELQCSDWSCRPLTEEQLLYAAADAYYLLQIYSVFECNWVSNLELNMSSAVVGLKEILEESIICNNIVKFKFCKASDMVNSSVFKVDTLERTIKTSNPWISSNSVLPMDESVSNIVRIFGERILLKDTDKRPRASRRKGRRSMSLNAKRKEKFQNDGDWQELPDTPPWDPSFGGDGCPKFLCDVMVEGLARHLRCVGIDAATPSSRKPEPRQLLDKAKKRKKGSLNTRCQALETPVHGEPCIQGEESAQE